jgi:hypothetical protein
MMRSTLHPISPLTAPALLCASVLSSLALSGCWGGARDCNVEADCFLGEVCVTGQCVFVEEVAPRECAEERPTECDRACVDLQADRNHCGACGVACGEGEFCSEGTCAPPSGCAVPIARARLLNQTDADLAEGEVRLEPLSTVQLDATASFGDGDIASYSWALVSKPVNSSARLTPNGEASRPTLNVDVAGAYVFDLEVEDAAGQTSCQPSRLVLEVTPPRGIYAEMTWSTAGDPDLTDTSGADVDLHYLHPRAVWNREPWDVFWFNPTADWGDDGDPAILVVDDDGAGPEAIYHPDPAPLSYRVGVHYYADNGFGPSLATARIYYNGVLSLDLADRELAATGSFWFVGAIEPATGRVLISDELMDDFPD